MSVHVLFDLFNNFGKRDQKRGLLIILSVYRSEFNLSSPKTVK